MYKVSHKNSLLKGCIFFAFNIWSTTVANSHIYIVRLLVIIVTIWCAREDDCLKTHTMYVFVYVHLQMYEYTHTHMPFMYMYR